MSGTQWQQVLEILMWIQWTLCCWHLHMRMDSCLKIGTISFKRCWRSLVLVSIVGVLMIFIAGCFTTTRRRRRDISKTTGGDYDVSPNPLALAQSRKDVRLQEQENLFRARQNGLRDFCKNITNRRRPMEENKDNNIMAHNKPEGILATSRKSDLAFLMQE